MTRTPFENATPRPWKSFSTYVYAPFERCANVCACSEPRATTELGYTRPEIGSPDLDEAHANAELIVTAVNAHADLMNAAQAAVYALKSYEYGNSSPELAQGVIVALEAALKLARSET